MLYYEYEISVSSIKIGTYKRKNIFFNGDMNDFLLVLVDFVFLVIVYFSYCLQMDG